MAPALNTHRRPFNTRGRGRGRGRPRLYGRGGSMMGSRSTHGSSNQPQHANGVEESPTPPRRNRGNNPTNGARRSSGFTFIRDISTIMGDPAAPGYKPREEWSYLEFHPDLDIGMPLRVMSAEEVDGDAYQPPALPFSGTNPEAQDTSAASQRDNAPTMLPIRTTSDPQPPQTPGTENVPSIFDGDDLVVSDLVPPPATPASRPSRSGGAANRRGGPGRPPKTPKPPPLSQQQQHKQQAKPPTEVLNLPKPSYRLRPNFNFSFNNALVNSVSLSSSMPQASGIAEIALNPPIHQQLRTTKMMANIGYQESEYWTRPKHLVRDVGGYYADDMSSSVVIIQGERKEEGNAAVSGVLAVTGENQGSAGFGAEGERVEYDMDEQDDKWLAEHNSLRRSQEVEQITREMFEITMTKVEKEWCALEKQIPKKSSGPKTPHPGHSHRNGNDGDEEGAEDSKCAICDDGECENSNAIVFCDGCDLAVHQDCYGVPYIPEGQWLCRKCSIIPKQVVNCILCPNTDGAFKQTVTNSWAHLLCAIWIPEVVISNQVYMEPIDGIEDIPKQRWKLTCYICRKRTGACIQCSNKNCFVAFHVTCARRARLFLKMKSSGGGLEFNHLKGFCDRHVPLEWRRENDVENAILDAQEYYAAKLNDSMWREGQLSGPSIIPDSQQFEGNELTPGNGESSNMAVSGTHQASPSAATASRRRKSQPIQNKATWKLPSGAPVIPQIVFNAVCTSITKFGVRKRKEYVAEVCKYWTLKREARRGAALIKRLQLPESGSELVRRNWKGLSQGRKKLQRRLEFAAKLRMDVENLRMLTDEAKRREKEKWRIVEMMRDYVEKVYFPEIPLMQPIFEKAQLLDKSDHFKLGFSILGSRLQDRIYATIDTFYTDLKAMLQSSPLDPKFAYHFPPELGIAGPSMKPFTGQISSTDSAGVIDTQVQRTVNRILKSIAPLIDEAKKKEDDLKTNHYAEAAKELEDRFEKDKEKARTASKTPISPVITKATTDKMDMDIDVKDETAHENAGSLSILPKKEDGAIDDETMDVDAVAEVDEDLDADGEYEVDDIALPQPIPDGRTTNSTVLYFGQQEVQSSGAENITPQPLPGTTNHVGSTTKLISLPSAHSTTTSNSPLPLGLSNNFQAQTVKKSTPLPFPLLSAAQWNGKHPPWYLQPFDPRGLVLHEERWLGREIAREASPLSELSEDEMLGLVGEVREESSSGLAYFPGLIRSGLNENGTGILFENAGIEDPMMEGASRADKNGRGRKEASRTKLSHAKVRGKGRIAGQRGTRTNDTDDEDDEDRETVLLDDEAEVDEQLKSEVVDSHERGFSGLPNGTYREYSINTNEKATAQYIISQRNGQVHDEMDVDPPRLPSPPAQQGLQETPQTPRTSSLSPLTSVVPEFDSSPLSNPPTHLSQQDQSPSRYRDTSGGSLEIESGNNIDEDDDDERYTEQNSTPTTPQRRSRKNMVFARQSNGRFGSNKTGTVSNSSSSKRRKTKRWI